MSKVFNQDAMAGVLLILASGFLFYQTFGIPEGAALWPRIVLAVLVLLSILVITRGVTRARGGSKEDEHDGEGERLTARLAVAPMLIVVLIAVYLAAVTLIGFFPSTVAFLAGYLWYERVRDWKSYVFVVCGVNLFVYVLFVRQLSVQLPSGLLFS